MLGTSVGGLDRVKEVVVVGPSAVHCHSGLEVEVLVEPDCRIAGEEKPVGLGVVVLRAGEVL